MNSVERKLNRFNEEVVGYAKSKSQVIEEKVNARLKKDHDAIESKHLGEAYELIQSEMKKIDKEINELSSKTLMENKIRLLNKRNEVIASVRKAVLEKLAAYMKTESYYKSQVDRIDRHISFMGRGKYLIYLNYSDKDLYGKLVAKYPEISFKIEKKSMNVVGGLKIHNLDTNMFIDDTLIKKIDDEMDDFLRYCGIEIDEK